MLRSASRSRERTRRRPSIEMVTGVTVPGLRRGRIRLASKGSARAAANRNDGTIQSSLVNAGVLVDPGTGGDVVGFVTYGPAKLANLRARPQVTVTFRAGWQWAAV